MGISEKILPPGPPGAPGGLLRGQTPQNKKIALLTKFLKEYFFSFMGSSRTLTQIHWNQKNLDPAFFLIRYTQKTGKKGQNVKQKKKFVSGWIFNFISIFNHFGQEDLEFSIKTLMKPI